MKILNVLLVTICFSSFIYAGEYSNYTDAQRKALMVGLRGSISTKCLDDYSANAAQNNKTLSDEEKQSVLDSCICITNKAIEKAGGEDFIFSSDKNTIIQKLATTMADKNQMMPVVKECVLKKASATN